MKLTRLIQISARDAALSAVRFRNARKYSRWPRHLPVLDNLQSSRASRRAHRDVRSDLGRVVGGECNSGAVSLLFFSDNVLERVAYNDSMITDKRTDLLEKHDYLPAARYGSSAEMQAVFR